MLTHKQFKVLSTLAKNPGLTQREIATHCGISLGTANTAYRECLSMEFISDRKLTLDGAEALGHYAVKNAVILAAGLSSRFAPISYERPKGLLRVRDEVLIERQIEQLQEVGIRDITIVVGYKKEQFFYLEDKYGVKIAVNTLYAERNNNASLMLVRELLDNTYICSSDNYFETNPFKKYEWRAYYSAQYAEGPTNEWCIEASAHDKIIGVTVGGRNSWYMIGHAYFDRNYSNRFRKILEIEYDFPQTHGKLWEDLYIEHIGELDMRIKRFNPPIIHEFDSLDELREFDSTFLDNLDSSILNNIVSVLGCSKNEIRDIYPLKQGLTNLSCHFATDKGEWVYRHPGIGTELIVDRDAEHEALKLAQQLGLDSTFVFGDPSQGWKISQFLPSCHHLDVHDDSQLKVAMEMARRLHTCNAGIHRKFSFYEEGKKYEKQILSRGNVDDSDYWAMSHRATLLNPLLSKDVNESVLCHNDFFSLNFLVTDDHKVNLIDWEYAGMGDYANDFGTMSVCDQLSEQEMEQALEHYFKRKPTADELRHCFGQVGMAGWCWYAWSLLKESEGESVGEWSYIYYRYGKTYLERALDLYGAAIEDRRE